MRRGGALASVLDPRMFGRHQLAALAATLVDFGAMIALVELAGATPPVATMGSAAAGAVTNFSASRLWAFRGRHGGTLLAQALRYGAVSLGGALLNAGLLSLVLQLATISAVSLPYVVARAAVAIAVSVFYTYLLHTRVVFRVTREPREPRKGGDGGDGARSSCAPAEVS